MGSRPDAETPYLLIGGGRLARHLGHYMRLLGIPTRSWVRADGVAELEERARGARAVLLLIPDDALAPFVREHDQVLGSAPRVHCSGSVALPGVVGCHPLGSFGDTLHPESVYRAIHFVVEEGPRSFEELFPDLPNPSSRILQRLKSRYHGAAVMSGNFTAMVWREAARAFADVGVPPAAWSAYLETVVHNLRDDPEGAVTGPIDRGDAGTIARHLDMLGESPWADVYRAFVRVGEQAERREDAEGRAPAEEGASEDSDRRARPDHEDVPPDRLVPFAGADGARRPLVATTCYDAGSASLLAGTELDFLLVGDSVAMVVHGHPSTRAADVAMLERHTAAVRRGAPGMAIVADIPWVASRYPDAGIAAARRLLGAGADAVKLEAVPGSEDVLRALRAAGIPVMGHVGLLPQLVENGEYRVAGRGDSAAAVLEAARAQEEAGCFAMVVECVPRDLARRLTEQLEIPTIGIGAGTGTDGQILVLNDLLGLTPGRTPRFVRAFARLGGSMTDAVDAYIAAVRDGSFPGPDESYA